MSDLDKNMAMGPSTFDRFRLDGKVALVVANS